MAKRTASAKKQARAGARRTVRNRGVRSEVKTLVVKARKSLATSAEDGLEVGVEAVRALDRASAKGILHANNAARRKSRLARQMAKLAASTRATAAASAPAPSGRGKAKAAPAKPAKSSAPAAAPAAPAKKK